MALVLVRSGQQPRFIKAAADTAPDLTSHPDMKAGAQMWIHDTDTMQRWTGSAWVTTTKVFDGS